MDPVTTVPAAFAALTSEIWSQVGTGVNTISSNLLLLIPLGFVFVGGVIGIVQRLMGTRRRGRR